MELDKGLAVSSTATAADGSSAGAGLADALPPSTHQGSGDPASQVRAPRSSFGGSPPLTGRKLSVATLNSRAPEQNQLQKNLLQVYEIDKYLGEGAFSKVWRCIHRKTQEPRAVKVIDMSPDSGVNRKDVRIEIAMMRLLRHENVVRCYDVFMEAESVNIVVDIFAGGDLMDGMANHYDRRGAIPEGQVRHLARQMVAAIAHVHTLNITHRDIKGENFLLDRQDIGDLACRVALADFGTAVLMRAGQMTAIEQVGTRSFWPPEIWRAERYGQAIDIWSLGVTLFVLLTGQLPFEPGETQQDVVCRSVADGELLFSPPEGFDAPCVEFLAACIIGDAAKRPTAAALAASSPWLLNTSRAPPKDASTSEKGLQVAGGCLRLLGTLAVACCHGLGEAWDALMLHTASNDGHSKQADEATEQARTQALAEPLRENADGDKDVPFTTGAAMRASSESYLGAEGDDVWIVVYDGNGVRVRKDKSLSADVLTAKYSGDLVRGKQDGEWLALTSEPGFMALGNADGDVLLVKKVRDSQSPSLTETPVAADVPPAEGWLVVGAAGGDVAATER